MVDLYGQCVQVSITNATGPMDNSLATSNTATEKSLSLHSPGTWLRKGKAVLASSQYVGVSGAGVLLPGLRSLWYCAARWVTLRGKLCGGRDEQQQMGP